MPENKGKGGKSMRRARNGQGNDTKRALLYKESCDQEYAQVLKRYGGDRVQLQCYDGVSRQGVIRGSLWKRVWINVGDIVLISLRGFDQATADIIHKYTADEARKLISYGELPASAKVNQTAIDLAFEGVNDEDVGFDFDEV